LCPTHQSSLGKFGETVPLIKHILPELANKTVRKLYKYQISQINNKESVCTQFQLNEAEEKA